MEREAPAVQLILSDAEKQAYLQEGKPLCFVSPIKSDDEQVSDKFKAARTIQASWIMELAKEPERAFRQSITIANAIVVGPLRLPYASFEYGLSITSSEFVDEVDLSFATFKRVADFSDSHFNKPITFRAAHAQADFIITRANFLDHSSFEDLRVDVMLKADGAHFRTANFSRINVAKGLSFIPASVQGNKMLTPACFTEKASFVEAHVEGVADLRGIQFNKDADFRGIRIDVALLFRTDIIEGQIYQTRFGGDTRFYGAKIQLNAEFDGAHFDGKLNFEAVQIGGALLCRSTFPNGQLNLTHFGDEARFFGVKIQGNADFSGARFAKMANFELMRIEGAAYFRSRVFGDNYTKTYFDGEVSFADAFIQGNAVFSGATFAGRSNFTRISIGGEAGFGVLQSGQQVHRTSFIGEVTFFKAKIGGNAEFGGAKFASRAVFELAYIGGNAHFRTLDVRVSATQQSALKISPLRISFANEVSFLDAHIVGNADFSGARFKKSVNFSRAHIGGVAFFRTSLIGRRICQTRFCGEALFVNVKIQNNAIFDAARFKGKTNFTLARIDGDASFHAVILRDLTVRTIFEDDVSFQDVQIGNTADFNGVQFGKEAIFVRARIGGDAFFLPIHRVDYSKLIEDKIFNEFSPVCFNDRCVFIDAKIKGNADFRGAKFRNVANFERLSIGRVGFFRAIDFIFADKPKGEFKRKVIETRFNDTVRFLGAEFQRGADFSGAKFEKLAIFSRAQSVDNIQFNSYKSAEKEVPTRFGDEVDFYGAQFKSEAHFQNTLFKKKASFQRLIIDGAALFQDAIFEDLADFREAHLSVAYFRNEEVNNFSQNSAKAKAEVPTTNGETKFHGEIDLRGFTYKQIYVEWEQIFNSEHLYVYDRQPYTQLEQFFHSKGDDYAAGNIYFESREHNRKDLRKKKQFLPAFRYLLERTLYRYGVRPYRLIGYGLLVILLGTMMFSLPGAVEHKEVSLRTSPVDLSYAQALGVSLRLFIPIVEIPSGHQWIPSQNPAPLLRHASLSFADYGSFHRLAGAVLVPLGVAALAGILHRKGKP